MNGVVNPGFETGDLTGWGTEWTDGTVEVTTTAHSGSYGAHLAATENHEADLIQCFIVSGNTFSMWLKGTGASVDLYEVDGEGYQHLYSGSPETWTQITAGTTVIGNYILDIWVTDGDIFVDDVSFDADPLPLVADFDASPLSGIAPLEVMFNNLSTGFVGSFLWERDGSGWVTFSTSSDPHFTFDPGTYSIRLTVSGGGASDIKTRAAYIVATPPAVDFEVPGRACGYSPLTVQFRGSDAGSWEWQYRDPREPKGWTTFSTDQSPSHTFDYGAILSGSGREMIALDIKLVTDFGTKERDGYIIIKPLVRGKAGGYVSRPSWPPTTDWKHPKIDFSGSPLTGSSPLMVTLTAYGQFQSCMWWVSTDGWQFDGIGTTRVITAEFTTGVYTIMLSATKPGFGEIEKVKTAYITVT